MAFVLIPGNPAPEGAEELHFQARDGTALRAMIAPARGPSRGTVIICQGWKEFIEKYFEVARELQARGFTVFAMDWRGQGLSGRQTNNPQKSYYRTLDDPAKDLGYALQEYGDRLPSPRILLAHSMGGGISLRALQRKYVTVDGALFNAPMWGIRMAPQMRPVAWTLSTLARRIGQFDATALAIVNRHSPPKVSSRNEIAAAARAPTISLSQPIWRP